MFKDIEFLKDLQKELKEQDNDCQAEPRFWVIKDYKWVPAVEGCGERETLYNSDGDSYRSVEDFIGDYLIESDAIEDLYYKHGRNVIADFMLVDSLREAIEFIESHFNDKESWAVVEEEEVDYIVENTFFITKAEAQQYLENNRHNLTSKAHTYGMSALRAPKVQRLWSILENLNWDDVIY